MDKKTKIKNKIINSSIKLMYLKGYSGTSVKDITDAAGIPKGSFYNYFKDKEQYAIDALHYYYSDLVHEAKSILKNQRIQPLDRIREFYKYKILWLEQKEFKFGCFIGNMTQEMGDINERISQSANEILNDLDSLIYNNLIEAQDQNNLRSDLNLKVLANFIINSWQGAMLRMKSTRNRECLDNFYIVLNEIIFK